VVLVANADQRAVAEATAKVKAARQKVQTFTVEQEAGPWNETFLSIPYLMVAYGLFAINASVILYALFRLAMVIKAGEFVVNLRNAIFLLGITGLAVYSSSLLLRTYAYDAMMLETFSTWCISLSFHLLLYLWSVFLMQVRHNKSVYYFRVLVAFGAAVVTLAFCDSVVALNVPPSDGMRTVTKIIGYLLPITQVVIAVAFLGYAVKFLRRRETVKISLNTYKALTRLGQVAVIAFVAYFAVAATNLDVVVSAMTTPVALAAGCILRMLSASIRGMALLTVLGVQVPRKATNIGSSSMFSSSTSSTGTRSSISTHSSVTMGMKSPTDFHD